MRATQPAAEPGLLTDPAAVLAAYGIGVTPVAAVPAACSPEAADSGLAGLIYPSYRAHVTSGHVAAADATTLREVREIIHRVAGSGLSLVLAPLGAGGHVDHVLVRDAAQRSGAPVAFYREFPHDRRDRASDAFIDRHGLAETTWPEPAGAKLELIRTYDSRLRTRLRRADIPLAPEVLLSAGQPCAAASSAWWR